MTLGTVSRMARRLRRRSKVNAAVGAKTTGILEPMTVHHQSLKVHYTDVKSKSSLLHAHQLQAMKSRKEGHENGEEKTRIRSDLAPGKHPPDQCLIQL